VTFLALEARRLVCDVPRRQISGLAVPWGIPGRTMLGTIRFASGSIRYPADLSRIKLLVQHDVNRSVGYALELADLADPAGLGSLFTVPDGAAGDAALAEAANRVRDGLSVGVDLDDDVYEALWAQMFSDDPSGVVDARGTLREVSLCAIPVFDDARVAGVAASRSETPVMTAPVTLSTPPAAVGEIMHQTPAAAPVVEAPAPVLTAAGPPVPGRSSGRGRDGARLTLEHMAELVAAVNRRELEPDILTAALTDITSADWVTPPAYVSELAGLVTIGRPMVQAFGVSKLPATGQKYHYPVVGSTPAPAEVAGEKVAIPTGPVTIVDAEVPVHTIAWGNDVSIQTAERSDPAFLALYWQLCAEYYARSCDLAAWADLSANATDVPGVVGVTAGDLLLAVIEAAEAGGRPVDVIVGALGFRRAVLGGATATTLPIAISDVLGSIVEDANLPAGTIVAGNKTAFTWAENPAAPARLQAVNVSLLGYDVGIYGYAAYETRYPESVAKGTVPPPAGTQAAGARAGSSSSSKAS
jgi:hypothetical protein